MPAGRPPKPRALKVLHGDDKGRINENEPMPRSAGSLEPPKHLNRRSKALWRRLAPDMRAKGVLTDWDLETLAAYCVAVTNAQEAASDLDRNGMVIVTVYKELQDGSVTYTTVKNPNFQVWRESTTAMVSLSAQLGLTPASRTKITTKGSDATKGGADLLSS